MTPKPETLCTGCGATVTQDSELYWRDSGGYKSCSPATGSSGLHRIEEELPPVAIKPEAPLTPLEKKLIAALNEISSWDECLCDHSDENCCSKLGVACAHCIADLAIAKAKAVQA